MFGFIRNLVFLLALLFLIALGTSFWAYGSVDPCRMLAAEMSEEAVRGLGEMFGKSDEDMAAYDGSLESTYRLFTSQWSTEDCAREYVELWWARLTEGD